MSAQWLLSEPKRFLVEFSNFHPKHFCIGEYLTTYTLKETNTLFQQYKYTYIYLLATLIVS
jgi:hypothetical protein